MIAEEQPIEVAVMALHDVTASTLFGISDLLRSVGRDWELVMSGEPGKGRFRPVVVGQDCEPMQVANEQIVQPEASLADCSKADIVCVPDILVPPGARLGERYEIERRWIRDRFEGGALIATACSGALLLAEEGLLDGLEATTHWAYCDAFRRNYPDIDLQPNRSLIVTGQGQRIVMAGGGTSWQDLTLYLIARLVGIEEAMQVAKIYLINWHDIGQQPFAALARTTRSDDATIAKCQEWIAHHYDDHAPVARMCELSGLSERSFSRRFSASTGLTPLEYVHSLRIEEAKHLLERTQMPIEAIALEIGYEDASFFSRLFKRSVQLTPAQFRKRFGALRETLSAAQSGIVRN